jgi:MFS family permease
MKNLFRQMTADKIIALTILVSALGYFVDIFDLLLFSIVRIQSLKDLGVPEPQLLDVGIHLLNAQMAGLFLGGILWGVLGDKYGRVTVLFGSILLYSVANIGNGFVTGVGQYAVLRFITGIGLAGEFGLGVTLAAELLPKNIRGHGATFIAAVGIPGAVLAKIVSDMIGWREAFIVGGVLGLCLLALRFKMRESGLYNKVAGKEDKIRRGNLMLFFKKPELLRKYLMVVLIGAPIWAAVGIFITFSPEFAKAFGMANIPNPGTAVLSCYAVQVTGGLFIGWLSQRLRSRKKSIFVSMILLTLATIVFVTVRTDSLPVFYGLCALMGIGIGYWAMFAQLGAEQFGTNIRATAATSIPNTVRGLTVPMTAGFHALIPTFGVIGSGLAVMGIAMALAFISLWRVRETFHAELDYVDV